MKPIGYRVAYKPVFLTSLYGFHIYAKWFWWPWWVHLDYFPTVKMAEEFIAEYAQRSLKFSVREYDQWGKRIEAEENADA